MLTRRSPTVRSLYSYNFLKRGNLEEEEEDDDDDVFGPLLLLAAAVVPVVTSCNSLTALPDSLSAMVSVSEAVSGETERGAEASPTAAKSNRHGSVDGRPRVVASLSYVALRRKYVLVQKYVRTEEPAATAVNGIGPTHARMVAGKADSYSLLA